ncbi:MAG: nitroreductase [Bernardetiaceae bacterium]|nr:nitroreductase [Bernardetiaceae bacterium]
MEKQQQAQTMRALIRSRRTIYPNQYTGEIIPDEQIRELLIDATYAPNHGRTEPWYFFVFSGEARAELGEFLATTYTEITPEDKFKKHKPEEYRQRMTLASHIIVLAMKRGDNPRIPEIEEVEAVACAVQNLQLSAHANSWATYWSSGAIAYHEKTKEAFGLREQDKILGFLYVGVPKEAAPVQSRAPIETKVDWKK